MKKTLLAGLALAMTASLSSASGDEWMTDFEAAKKKAAAENKDLLVDFTGSDWCGWCIKLVDEVFKHDAFKTGVADKFVLVELDFPRDKSKLSEATQMQNAELQKKYDVKGFPTILLLDSKGLPFAQTGYQAGGPEKYLAHLDELRAKRIKRDESLAAAEKLEGVEKAKALVAALKELPETQLSHYTDITGQIAALDPNDETGFVAAQKRKEAEANLEKEVMAAMRSGNTDDAIAKIDKFIADYKVEGEEKQGLLGMKMNPLMAAKKFDEAAKVIDELIAAAPESKAAKFAESFKPRLQKMKEAASQPKEDKPNPPHGEPGHVHEEE
ncbi:MAG: thioredoxin family protein [Akkermansiaceae bacterium]|nr:thioredoxin family protein [Akkermansiaceae bacterium]